MSQIDKLASKSGVLASMTGSEIPTMNIEITNKFLKTDSPEKVILSEEPTVRSGKDSDSKLVRTEVASFEQSPKIRAARPISAHPASRAARNMTRPLTQMVAIS